MRKTIGLLMVMAFALMSMVFATVTIDKPVTNGLMSGDAGVLSSEFNITITNLDGAANCTLSVSTANGANGTSSIELITVDNVSGVAGKFNGTFDTNILIDSNDFSFTATCWNETTSETSSANTGVTIDNTAPTCTDDTGFSSGDTVSPTATWTVTGTDVRSGNLFSLNIGGNVYTLTDSVNSFIGNTLAASFTGNVPESIYPDTFFAVTDGTNRTECTSLTDIRIKDSDNAQKGKIIALLTNQNRLTQEGNTFSVLPLSNLGNGNMGMLLLLGVGAWFLLKKKKN